MGLHRLCCRTCLGNDPARIGLLQAFPQRSTVALQKAALAHGHTQVPPHAIPDALPLPHIPPRRLAHQPNEIKVADDSRPQRLQHLPLQVVVVLKQALLGVAGSGNGIGVGRGGVVYGDAVDVVDRADEVVDGRRGGEASDQWCVARADELCLEADEDMDLRGVEGLKSPSLDQIGFVAGDERREAARLTFLLGGEQDRAASGGKKC